MIEASTRQGFGQRRAIRLVASSGPPAAVLAALLGAWEVSGRAAGWSTTPLPSEILGSIATDPWFYIDNASVTLFEAVAGLLLALAVAVVVASAFAVWTPVRRTVLPLVVASQTIPLIAVAPLLASVIGDGLFSRVLVTAWLCWFPAVVSTTHGMLDVDPRHLTLFEMYKARRRDLFWKLRAPSCAGALLSGVRAAAGFALISAIVVEYSGADRGLGAFLMGQVLHPSDPTRVFGVIVTASIGGLLLTEAAHAITRRALARFLPATR